MARRQCNVILRNDFLEGKCLRILNNQYDKKGEKYNNYRNKIVKQFDQKIVSFWRF